MENQNVVPGTQNGQPCEFSYTQRGAKLLNYDGYLFNKNKTYKSRTTGDVHIYWQCERRRDVHYTVYLTTNVNGNLVKGPLVDHNHAVSNGRAESQIVRHAILVEAERRPEAAPASLLNEFVTPDVVMNLGSEKMLKQAIQRKRRRICPTEPTTASDVVITGQWTKTLDGADWYLGKPEVNEDDAYIFSTKQNLLNLNVSCHLIICF